MKTHPVRLLLSRALLSGISLFLSLSAALAQSPQVAPARTFQSVPFTDSVEQMTARDRLRSFAPEGQPQAVAEARRVLPEVRSAGPEARSAASMAPIEPSANAPQTIQTGFVAISLQDQFTAFGSGSFPPDTNGAIGPNHFVEIINSSVAIYNRTGTRLSHVSLTSFFTATIAAVTYPRNGSFDPRVIFDRRSGRWMAVVLERGATSGQANEVILAVSATNDPTGVWNKYLIPVSQPTVGADTFFTDYDTLGTDDNGVYVGVRIFKATSGTTVSSNASIAAVPKSQVLAAGLATVTVFPNITDMYSTPQPAHNFDAVAATDRAWFVSSSVTVFANVNYRRLTWSGATPTLDATSSALTTPTYSSAFLNAPASGSTTSINCGDDRLQMAVIRNNSLWTCRNIGTDSAGGAGAATRTACEWVQANVTTATPTLTQSGRVFDPAAADPRFYYYPSIMVSGQGHAVMAFSGSKSTEFVGAYFTGRLTGDTAGTMGAVDLIKAGVASYTRNDGSGRNRWGDYSYTSLDPNDDMSLWTIQEYAETGTNIWGTWIAKTIAPPPATPVSAGSTVAQGASNVNVVITGTSASGSGFYDPGAGFTNRIAASVGGAGVTVNSVAYNSPTQVTLNVSVTGGAAIGARTVTVTNPDLQAATSAAGILTVTAAGPVPVATATPASQTTTSGTPITTIVLTSTEPGTTYAWTRDNTVPVTGIAASGAGNISGMLTNTTNAPVTVTFTITPTAAGVTGPTTTATVTVNPVPNAVATPASQTTASGTPITTIVLSGNVTGTTYAWTRDNTGTVTGIAASGSGNIAGTLTNTTFAPVTVTFTVTPTANGVPGPTTTATVLVNPTPNAIATPASQTTTTGTPITTIVLTSSVAGTTFTWTRDNTVPVTGIAASGAGNISGTLTNTTGSPVTVTFTITPTANGVTGPTTTATVTVNPVITYTVTTTGNAIVVTDIGGVPDPLAVSEPSAGNIQFDVAGKTFSVDGGTPILGSSGVLSRTGVTQITLNAGTGADNVTVGAFTGTLPNVAIGSAANKFGSVSFTGAVTLGAANTLTADASGDISNTGAGVLSAGGNITLSSGNDVLIFGNILHPNGADATLTVRAGNNINFGSSADVTSTSNKLHVVLNSNRDAVGTGAIRLQFGTAITSNGGDITLGGGADPLTTKAIGNATLASGILLDSATLTAGAGAINLRGQGAAGGVGINTGVNLSAAQVHTTTGNITIVAQGGTLNLDGVGVFIDLGQVGTADGAIDITGTGGSGTGIAAGVLAQNAGLLLVATGTGTVTVTGTGGTGSGVADSGVQVAFGASIRVTNGALAVSGTATSGNSAGVRLTGGTSALLSTGAGTVAVTGTGAGTGFGFEAVDTSVVGGPGATGAVTITADKIELSTGTPTVQTTSPVTVRQKTIGQLINVGAADSGTTLGLTDAELDRITAPTVNVGDAQSGPITISLPISPLNYRTLAFGGSTTFAAAGGFISDIGPTAADIEKISVTGTVTITAGASLAMAATGGFVPLNGQSFPILTNDLADAITGTFAGLPEGQPIPAFLGSGVTAQITYLGGTGNDVVIGTNQPPVAGVVSVSRFPTQSVKIPVSQLTGAATDPDPGDTISLFSVANGLNGTAQILGGFVFYTPTGIGTPGVRQNPDTFSYVIKDNHGASATGSVTVTIAAPPNAASLNITGVTLLPGGGVAIDFSGIPGYIYGLQFKVTLADPVWQNIASVAADPFGVGRYVDGPPPVGSTSGFYRLIFPIPSLPPGP